MPSLVIHLKETLIYVYKKPCKRILSTALFVTGNGKQPRSPMRESINCGLFINQS